MDECTPLLCDVAGNGKEAGRGGGIHSSTSQLNLRRLSEPFLSRFKTHPEHPLSHKTCSQ